MRISDINLENLNYLNDRRTLGPLKIPTVQNQQGDELVLPTKWVICDVCQGNGTVVNPSIDAGGLTSDLEDPDPQFMDDYRNGVFDIQCKRCEGRTTMRVVDRSQCDQYLLDLIDQEAREEALIRAAEIAELAAGA